MSNITYQENKEKNIGAIEMLLEKYPERRALIMECTSRTNLLYVLADMLEMMLMDTSEKYKAIGYTLRQDVKRNYNAVIKCMKNLRFDVRRCRETTQDAVGNDSDMLMAILLMLIDRTGDDDMELFKFYNYIKMFPSKKIFDVSRCDDAFKYIGEDKDE